MASDELERAPMTDGKRGADVDKAEKPESRVRRPISFKIFGITGLLLVLMALVTLISTINLGRVDRQLSLLSDYYIPLDQTLSDLRYHYLLQSLLLERAREGKPSRSLEDVRKTVQAVAQELGNCE